MVNQSIYLPRKEYKQLEALALERGVTDAICAQQIVKAFLRDREEKNICAD